MANKLDPNKLRKKLDAVLRDVVPWECGDFPYGLPEVALRPEDKRNLPPFSVFLCLSAISHFPAFGRGEKVAWSIPIRYKGAPYLLAHGKFGFAIHAGEESRTSQSLERQLVRCLRNAVRIADGLVQPYAREQMRLGNITVENRYALLRGMYEFFREKAEEAYALQPPVVRHALSEQTGMTRRAEGGRSASPKIENVTDADPFVTLFNHHMRCQREGFYFASAALDAYFSQLEHTLVLLLPFVKFDPKEENLADFIGSNWSNKFKRIFDLGRNRKAERIFSSLQSTKERLRNTIFHGGFAKDGLTLYFHIPRFGAVPMSLSRYSETLSYSLHPIDDVSFQQICTSLDKTDNFLKAGPLHLAMSYIQAGLNVAFDQGSREEYSKALGSRSAMERLIEGVVIQHDMAANMDW